MPNFTHMTVSCLDFLQKNVKRLFNVQINKKLYGSISSNWCFFIFISVFNYNWSFNFKSFFFLFLRFVLNIYKLCMQMFFDIYLVFINKWNFNLAFIQFTFCFKYLQNVFTNVFSYLFQFSIINETPVSRLFFLLLLSVLNI